MSSQTPWNSQFNNAKGALLVGNATRPIVRTIGSDGQVLTANSANADGVEWASPGAGIFSIVQQTFAANGTYTPTVGMTYCIIEGVGGGGGGGGARATGAGNNSVGGGGGGGGYSKGVFSAAAVGVSQAVVIGAGGAGVAGGTGNTGGTTTVGALISSTGGAGGIAGPNATANIFVGAGGASGIGTIGATSIQSSRGFLGFQLFTSAIAGNGGTSIWGQGGAGAVFQAAVGGAIGSAGSGRGAGGGGSSNGGSQAARVGGAGSAGFVVITEFVS